MKLVHPPQPAEEMDTAYVDVDIALLFQKWDSTLEDLERLVIAELRKRRGEIRKNMLSAARQWGEETGTNVTELLRRLRVASME